MSRLIDADELVKKFKQWMGIEYRMQMFIADVIKTIKDNRQWKFRKRGSGFHAVSGCREITITDFTCVL